MRSTNHADLNTEFSSLVQTGNLSGWFGNPDGGVWVQRFERAFAQYHKVKHAIAVSSGTAALHCALLSCGVKPEDRIVTTSYTHVGGVAPIVMCGAHPLFIDTERGSLNMDADKLPDLMTKKPAAIIASHQLGNPCQMDRIMEASDGTIVVEDASQSLGAAFRGKKVGTIGDIGIFSVGGDLTKTITTGEGGMIVTNNDELAEKCRALRNHGEKYKGADFLCYDYRMSDLHALVGCYFLQTVEQEIQWQIDHGKYIVERIPEYLVPLQAPCRNVEPSYYILGFEAVKTDPATIVRTFNEENVSKNRPRMNISRGYSQLVYQLPPYQRYSRPCPDSEEKLRKVIWIDYHRRPRSYPEIDRMLEVARSVR